MRQSQNEKIKKIERKRRQVFKIPPSLCKGLYYVTFNHLKIKLRFQPSEVVTYVNKNTRFYLSLRHLGGYWRVKRDTLPADCKWSIYKLFFTKNYFAINDENILKTIDDIYRLLVQWSHKNQEFRLTKYKVSGKVKKLCFFLHNFFLK